LELAPFGVRVITTITGSVKTEINEQGSGFMGLRGESRYIEVEGRIMDVAFGKGIPNQITAEGYAEKVVGVTRIAGWLPQGVMVC
jgi:hypothetical protein